MLIIRFIRTGKKNQPFFRIVVTDKRNAPRGGNFLEVLGFFNPLTKEKALKKERIKYWLSVGAKTSDRVHNLLISEKVIQGKKIDVHKKSKKKEEKPKEAKPKEEPKEEKKEEPKVVVEESKEDVKEETKVADKPKEEVKEKPKEKKKEEPKKVDEAKEKPEKGNED